MGEWETPETFRLCRRASLLDGIDLLDGEAWAYRCRMGEKGGFFFAGDRGNHPKDRAFDRAANGVCFLYEAKAVSGAVSILQEWELKENHRLFKKQPVIFLDLVPKEFT